MFLVKIDSQEHLGQRRTSPSNADFRTKSLFDSTCCKSELLDLRTWPGFPAARCSASIDEFRVAALKVVHMQVARRVPSCHRRDLRVELRDRSSRGPAGGNNFHRGVQRAAVERAFRIANAWRSHGVHLHRWSRRWQQ